MSSNVIPHLQEPLDAYTVKQLREYCRAQGIIQYSGMRKPELIAIIHNFQTTGERRSDEVINNFRALRQFNNNQRNIGAGMGAGVGFEEPIDFGIDLINNQFGNIGLGMQLPVDRNSIPTKKIRHKFASADLNYTRKTIVAALAARLVDDEKVLEDYEQTSRECRKSFESLLSKLSKDVFTQDFTTKGKIDKALQDISNFEESLDIYFNLTAIFGEEVLRKVDYRKVDEKIQRFIKREGMSLFLANFKELRIWEFQDYQDDMKYDDLILRNLAVKEGYDVEGVPTDKLRENILSSFDEPTFFHNSDPLACENTEGVIYGEEFASLPSTNYYIYGIRGQKGQCFTTEELYQAFNTSQSFSHPYEKFIFPRRVIKRLYVLAHKDKSPVGIAFRKLIKEMLNRRVYNIEEEFKTLPSSEKVKFRRALQLLLNAGMYARRWKGPGHPYPLSAIDTIATLNSEQTEINTSKALVTLETYVNNDLSPKAREIFNMLKVVYHDKQGYKFKVTNGSYQLVKDYIHLVMYNYDNPMSCIRMNSISFVCSANYWIMTLFNEPEQFNPVYLDNIL